MTVKEVSFWQLPHGKIVCGGVGVSDNDGVDGSICFVIFFLRSFLLLLEHGLMLGNRLDEFLRNPYNVIKSLAKCIRCGFPLSRDSFVDIFTAVIEILAIKFCYFCTRVNRF